jgi:hypothetical protein
MSYSGGNNDNILMLLLMFIMSLIMFIFGIIIILSWIDTIVDWCGYTIAGGGWLTTAHWFFGISAFFIVLKIMKRGSEDR